MLTLRPFQKQAMDAIETSPLKQKHIVCVAPTGSGKSLIYERAAALPHRKTLLITPLVALARQQHEKLIKSGISVSLGAGGHSQGPPSTKSGAWIISPEILDFPHRLLSLERWKPNLLVVDECHCLWEWGESFRPAFARIPELLKNYTIPQSLWLTATLPFDAREKLREILPPPVTEIGTFDLPKNLQLFIKRVSWKDRAEALVEWISHTQEAGIVFVSTREATLRISRLIESTGKKVLPYHGGMSLEERKNSEALVSHKIPDVIVSTSAFGMGMDYPHLSYVILWQAPTSLLSLVQTIGRVGRNQNKIGKALVFWENEDFRLLEWTVKNSSKRREELSELMKFLHSSECRLAGLKRYFDRSGYSHSCGSCDICLYTS